MRWIAARVLAGVRRRTGSAVLVGVLAAIVAVVAATTPILIQAVQQASLEHALTSSSALDRSVIGNASSDDRVSAVQAGDRAAKVTAALGRASFWTPSRTYREQNDLPLQWDAPRPAAGRPKQRIADLPSCAELRFVVGRCPRTDGEGAIGATTFVRSGIRLGSRITLKSISRTVSVVVVGVYDPTTTTGRLEAHPGSLISAPITGLDPDLLLAPDAFSTLHLPTTAFALRVLRTDVPLAALPAVRADIARARAVPLTAASAAASTNALTSLDDLLDRIDGQRAVASVILSVVAAGAFGLTVFAFVVVAQRLGRVRAAEWALPRLRGMSRRRRLTVRFAEPLLALLVGALVGTAAAIAVALSIAGNGARGSVVDVVPTAIGIAAIAAGAGAVAIVLVGAAADRRALDDQLRRSVEPRELSRGALVAQAVIVVAALASVVALVASPGAAITGAGVLAPVLVALALGFIGLRIAVVAVRRGTRAVPTSLTGLIVWRRSSRSPSLLVPSVLVAAAVALGSFVVITSATADALADATAEAGTAATTVLHVRTPERLPLLAAVARADPTGRSALAAEERTVGEGTGRVIAVDTARLAAVSTWRSGWAGLDAASLVRRLAPPVQPSLRITGSRLHIAVDGIAPGPVDQGAEEFRLVATVQSPSGVSDVALGTFDPISAARTFTASIPCAQGCTFVSLSVRCVDQYPPPWSLHLVVRSLSTDVEPTARFEPTLRSGSWMSDAGHVPDPTLPDSSAAHPGPSGLAVDLADTIGARQPAVRVADTVEPLPVLLGATTSPDRFPGAAGTTVGTGIDGSALLLRPVGRASALPRLLGDGVLVDLRRMLPQVDRSDTSPDQQVWVGRDLRAVEARLRAEKVTIVSTETLVAATRAERAEAGPLSARSALVGAVGALAVVLLALLGGRLLAAPGRRRQWNAFAAAGVPLPRLRRLVAIELLAPAAVAVVIGAASGVGTFLLALPHLPLADTAPSAPPSGVVPPWPPVVLLCAATLLVVLGITAVVTRVETRDVDRGGRA